jgi:capsular polysaccharide biosynthesis protein
MNPALSYLQALKPRWPWILGCVLLALAGAGALLILHPAQYRSTATVQVRPPSENLGVLGSTEYAQAHAATYAALATSNRLSARVIANLGLDLKPEALSNRVTATQTPNTGFISIAVLAPSAEQAQKTTTAFVAELTATVISLESMPDSTIPRSELLTVTPPQKSVRLWAWGAPVPVVLLGAMLVATFLSSLVVALHASLARPKPEAIIQPQTERRRGSVSPPEVLTKPRAGGQHRRPRRR